MIRRTLTLAGCASLIASAARGQEGTQCSFESNHPVVVIAQQNTFTGGGVVVRCPAKRITLRADSLESYGAERRIFLVGNVDYNEPRLKLTSDQLTYFVPDERILAVGRVNTTLPSGSKLVGPQAEYRRAAPRLRTVSEMTAIGRPSVTLVEGPTAGRDSATSRRDTARPPTVVIANTLFVRGDSLIYGSGQVDIRRPDLTAAGDSVFLDSGREFMRLLRSPRIESTRDRPYRLSGQVIDVHSRNRQLERVVAKGNGSAVSDDMTLKADTIDLRVASDLLQSAVAWGPTGARAVSPTQTITADSITADMPGQRVRTVTASRRAYAEAQPDTLRVRTTEKDWLRGDTIVARFDTAASAPRDTARQPEIKQLVARGNAKSLYHLAPADSAARVPAINYVTGEVITIAFDSQRVTRVTVAGQRAGVYLEPADTASATPRSGGQRPTPRAVPPTRPPSPDPRRPVGSNGLDTAHPARRTR